MTDHPSRSWHDMGGLPAGPVSQDEHDFTLSEKRVDALLNIVMRAKLMTVDELRRSLEEMGPEAFETRTYYERWIGAINRTLIDRGVYATEELMAKMAEVEARGESYGEASLG